MKTSRMGGFSINTARAYHRAMLDPRRQLWAVVQSSAEKRLGRPLLRAYLLLAVLGFVVVVISLLVDRFG